MTSSRLPGKPMMKIGEMPMLGLHIKRLKKSTKIDEVYVAMTTNSQDNIMADYCLQNDIKYFRGSENDVLSRYENCANVSNADVIVRVTGDCPLIDAGLVDNVVENYFSKNCDYSHLDITKYPRGFDCEVFSRTTLREAYEEATKPSEREHVTSFIYNHPERYILSKYSMEEDYSDLRFCVDQLEDLKLVEAVNLNFKDEIIDVGWKDIVDFVKSRPEIKRINSSVEQHVPIN